MIPLMNISRQYFDIKKEIDEALFSVLESGQFIMGNSVESFESDFANYNGVKYAIGVGNGTDALVIALKSLGIGKNDEVITSAMSFFATAESIASVGAKPVFVDCTSNTGLIDPEQIENAITKKTKAIIPVHLYGQCSDMNPIMNLASKYGLKVIEDAAQAAGAEYKGKKAGSIGDIGCISFFPTKNLGAFGDGGCILTNNEKIARKCRAFRVHGSGLDGQFIYNEMNCNKAEKEIVFNGNSPKYFNFIIGFNSRLDAIQAAILSVKLKYLDMWNTKRRTLAKEYENKIDNQLVEKLLCEEYNNHIFYVYIIKVQNRDGFRKYMNEQGIATGVYFPVPLHLQVAFNNLGYEYGDFPNAEDFGNHSVAIPIFPELEEKEQEKIINCINLFKS